MGTRLDVSALPFEGLIGREWLATNGLGGYACSSLPGMNTRKYHGLLVAAMAPPVRRMVLLSRLEETVHRDGWPYPLSCNEYPGAIHPEGHRFLRAFSLDPCPRWAYQGDGWTIEKSLCLLKGRNTVCLSYTLLGGGKPIDLELGPLLALRGIHELTYQWNGRLLVENKTRQHHRVPPTGRTPEVFFAHDGAFEHQPSWYFNTIYRREQDRGYRALEDLWLPGVIRRTLAPGQSVHFACSTDPIDLQRVIDQAAVQRTSFAEAAQATATFRRTSSRPPPPLAEATKDEGGRMKDENRKGSGAVPSPLHPWTEPGSNLPAPFGWPADAAFAALARAAEQFVAAMPQEGSVEKSIDVVWQYPWSAPSGRGTLIAFAGLFLVSGKLFEGRSLLLSLAATLDRGLLPSEFPEAGSAPLYHGADVSLWFVNAVHQYLRYSGDENGVHRHLYEPLVQIVEHYHKGTGLGIAADSDGLLGSRAAGLGTSWMDAKAAEGVITPRHGRPVELNALWYNALCVVSSLAERFGDPARAEALAALAGSAKLAFNRCYWNEPAGCCFDVIGDDWQDASVRPNQLLAVSLPFAVLNFDRHEKVLDKVRAELLTPYGLRTLSPHDPGYQGRYGGNVVTRDRAHHNGSVFPWLLGPLVTALARVRGRGEKARAEALQVIRPCLDYLTSDGLGQLPELFDGNFPHAAGGAIASAVSVGEVFRCYVEDVLDNAPEAAAAPGAEAAGREAVIVPPRVTHPA